MENWDIKKAYGNIAENIVEKCFQLGFRCSVVGIVKAGQSAPRTYRICIDLEIK